MEQSFCGEDVVDCGDRVMLYEQEGSNAVVEIRQFCSGDKKVML